MASRDSSTGSSYSAHVQTFRAYKSKDHQGEQITRISSSGIPAVTYNHRARGYEANAPSPSYHDSSYKPKKTK
ncbi:hypothetical protein O1611_g2680 [Lasiodiplodia mahajangana]|uniref:Uncharacterized protein n=1 Tax=Lasiodiplodia mahajangana TaxID=1108764 RepID=A0ACC2JUL2_9PEZI|nr:hypothetical protein O1611_g2680 [Lasiodiplodia mahajangana]